MNEPRRTFRPGQPVTVRWMGERVEATIHSVETLGRGRRPLKEPQYRVAIAGVNGHPYFAQSEIEGERVVGDG